MRSPPHEAVGLLVTQTLRWVPVGMSHCVRSLTRWITRDTCAPSCTGPVLLDDPGVMELERGAH